VVLTEKNYERKFENSQGNWMMAYSMGGKECPECKALKDAWGKAGRKLTNHVKFGWVECNGKGKELCEEHKVTDLPRIVTYKNGKKEGAVAQVYTGEHTADALEAHAKSLLTLATPNIIQINKKIIEDWMKMKPFNPHLLYLSEEKGLPEVMQALVLEYEDGTDQEIMWGAALGRHAKKVMKHYQMDGQDLPLLLQVIGEPAGEPDAEGHISMGFTMRGIISGEFHMMAAAVDDIATKWQYQRVMYAKKYKGFMPDTGGMGGESEDEDEQSALKDEL